MRKGAQAYVWIIILLGLPLGFMCSGVFLHDLVLTGSWNQTYQIIWLVGLCALCRSFPIYMSENQALDLTVICILTTYLHFGPEAAIFVYIISAFISFEKNPYTKHAISIYNTSIVKTLFNTGNIVLSVIVSTAACSLVVKLNGWQVGNMAFPDVLLPAIVFTLFSFLSNGIIALARPALNCEIEPGDIQQTLFSLVPNVLAAAPLGLIIAVFFALPHGNWMVFLTVVPLMLARYSWRMYLQSKLQQKNLINAFVSVIEARDIYTQGHSKRVEEYAVLIAREMRINEKQITLLREGAVLHDIGKIGIDDRILRKPAPLDEQEYATMKQHTQIGAQIVEPVGLNQTVSNMIRYHHERYDGHGYPAQLSDAEIPLFARILCVADAFDAMTSDRPYRRSMPRETALRIIREESGKQFDPNVVEAFMRVMGE